MTSDSTPVFALEKEALKTEIETGLQVGVDHLEDKPMKRKPVEKYHNTRYLLKQYRKVAYAIQISESDMNVRMEMEHGTRLSTLEVNAELAGVDLSGSKLEGYARTVIRSKNMLQIIKNALNTVRLDPDHGELMYQILYLTYFSERKLANREAILAELERIGFQMSMVTYHSYLNMAIKAIDRILWGYVKETGNHVMYRVTPIFEGDNLLANGVLMEGYSVEDKGAGVSYCVFAYNVQPGIEIDYATGESKLADSAQQEEQKTATVTPTPSPEPEKQEPATRSEASQADYILNTNTKKFHYPTCSSVNDMKEKNKQEFFGTRDEAISNGYSPCGRCKP